ncbi:FAD-dependent oxidoreductase [Micromonospora sp. BRA006-A]|nr:FAD-dependent oxidoreductase [Micromonospora sp. BRA006-A]
MRADVLVVGGGLGGVAAALAAACAGRSVILTEEFDWLGGQLTSQAVPPDEHSWIEQFGATASYRELRHGIRDYYRRHYPLTERSRAWTDLNPGAGWVSRLCHEPRVAVAVLEQMLAPYRGSGRLTVLQPYRPVAAETDGDRVTGVTLVHRDRDERIEVEAPYVLDATETGELLPLTGTEYVTGFESQAQTGEPSAPAEAQPLNMQAVSVCFALDHVDGDHTIDRPAGYDFWRDYKPDFWGDRLLSWRSPHPRTLEIVERSFAEPGRRPAGRQRRPAAQPGRRQPVDVPAHRGTAQLRRRRVRQRHHARQLADDRLLRGPVIDVPNASWHLSQARELSYSVLYWLQTEAPRADGGTGYPGPRLRGDVTGSPDGLAQAP